MTELHVNRDGTTLPWDGLRDGLRQILPPGVNESLLPGAFLDDYTALQIGMFYILSALTFTTVDRRRLIEDGVVETNQLEFQRILLDWPEVEGDRVPVPSATIYAPGEASLDLSGPLSGQQLLEETLDQFAPGTVLRKLGETTAELEVLLLLAHKDERSAVRRGLIDAFMSEPDGEQSGRRVTVAPYYGRVARYDLVGISYPDTPDQARQGQWPLSARFTADVEIVKLVAAPSTIRPPRFNVEAT